MYSNFMLFALFILVLLVIRKPLGVYIYKVYHNEKTWLDYFAKPLEYLFAKSLHVNLTKEQTPKAYLAALLLFCLASFVFVYLILSFQGVLAARVVRQEPMEIIVLWER